MFGKKYFVTIGIVICILVYLNKSQTETLLFSDNFNPDNQGAGKLNYDHFNNFTVRHGTVDLIGHGFFDYYPGYGLYIDLGGSTNQAGILITKTAFNLSPGRYQLQFSLGGSPYGDTNTVNVSLGSIFSKKYTLASSDALTPITETITVLSSTTGYLSFQNPDHDNNGLILDDISLTKLPQSIP